MENNGTMAYIKTGNDALTEVAANGICDLRRDVAKSEADIERALGRILRHLKGYRRFRMCDYQK